MFVEEVQNTFIRDDHANMILSCAAIEGDPGGLGAYFPDLANSSSRQTRRFSRDVLRRSSGVEINRRDSLAQELVRLKSIAKYQTGVTGAPNVFGTNGDHVKTHTAQDMMTFGKGTIWAEYFNNMRKCWEPLLEKIVATVLFEKVGNVLKYLLFYFYFFMLFYVVVYCVFAVNLAWYWFDDPHC